MFYVCFIGIVFCILISAKLDALLLRVSLFIFLIMIILIAGLRYQIGTDYATYREIYINLSFDNLSYLEPGYRYVNLFFKYIGLSYEASVFIFAIITNVLFYLFIRRYSVSVPVSLLLYLCLNYYFIAFNTVRQMIGIAIFLNGIDYAFKKKYLYFFLITVFAALFHYTIFIGMLYPIFKINRKRMYMIIWLASIPFIVLPIQNIIIKLIPASFKYASYFTSFFFTKTSSAAVFKLIVPNMFVILILYYISVFDKTTERLWVNVFIFSVAFANIAHGVNVLIRLNYVFQISEIIFYPLVVSKIQKFQKPIVSWLLLGYFVVFYIFTVLVQGAQGVVPYQSVLFL
ncbi:EpsG family protein [Treponema denticola]|uniref:EpsG family protein n=1 Tax=Treponema denticola TaxID=158 RepID=UPI002103322F|nr:EpsG family protein [Treponema denticola]UTY23930.1 EpsG family protein [Treponema denticola]